MNGGIIMNANVWRNKNVFITGHAGFKGSWLCLMLHSLGARITGYSLHPPTDPSLFGLCRMDQFIPTIIGNVVDREHLQSAILSVKPDIVIHMAAQPLVRESYQHPVDTFQTNVMGTVYLLEAVRHAVNRGVPVKAVINVTSDKCYENKEWPWSYRENDRLGGYDPYSNSKACSELVTDSYRNSFFHPKNYGVHGVGIAAARAGNVIGGGDWAADRLIPDCIRTLMNGGKIRIRSPHAIRPWQHVLDPLSGYVMLAEKLYEHGPLYSEGWNFGPDDDHGKTVEWIVQKICAKWGKNASYEIEDGNHPHEAHVLRLDSSKAKLKLGWHPRWDVEYAIEKIVEWTEAYRANEDVLDVCLKQIEEYRNAGINR